MKPLHLACRELSQNSQPVRNKKKKKLRKHTSKKNNHMHKTIFTWFGNLPTSTELQEFHYYQGKIQSAAVQFFFSLKIYNDKIQIIKNTFSTSCTQDSQWATNGPKIFPRSIAPGPLRGLSMSATTWACQPKPLHRLSRSID